MNPVLNTRILPEFNFIKGTYQDDFNYDKLVLIFTTADGKYTIKLTCKYNDENHNDEPDAIKGIFIIN